MGVGSGLYMYDEVVRCSRSLSHLLVSSCKKSSGRQCLLQATAGSRHFVLESHEI